MAYITLILLSFIIFILVFIIIYQHGKNLKLSSLIEEKDSHASRYNELFLLMYLWHKKILEKKNLITYFNQLGIKNIGVYGIGYVGECIIKELENSNVSIEYIIDRSVNQYNGLNVLKPTSDFPQVDLIIVTAINSYDEIQELLLRKTTIPIISIKEIILLL